MGQIVRSEDVLGGEPRIEGTRVGVRHIGEMVERGGSTAETVSQSFGVEKVDVYRALIYYHEHPVEMAKFEEQEAEAIEAHPDEQIISPPAGDALDESVNDQGSV